MSNNYTSNAWKFISGNATNQYINNNNISIDNYTTTEIQKVDSSYEAKWRDTRTNTYCNVIKIGSTASKNRQVAHWSLHASPNQHGSQHHIIDDEMRRDKTKPRFESSWDIQARVNEGQIHLRVNPYDQHRTRTLNAELAFTAASKGLNKMYPHTKRRDKRGGGKIIFTVSQIPYENKVKNLLLVHFYFLFLKKESNNITFEELKKLQAVEDLKLIDFINKYVRTIPEDIISFHQNNIDDIVNDIYIEILSYMQEMSMVCDYVGIDCSEVEEYPSEKKEDLSEKKISKSEKIEIKEDLSKKSQEEIAAATAAAAAVIGGTNLVPLTFNPLI